MSWHNIPGPLRLGVAVSALVAALVLPFQEARAEVPDYKLGDVAAQDVITPVPLLVINPEATAVLKQRVAEQVLFVVRQNPQSAAEAETELRQSIATVRANFTAALQRALPERAAGSAIDAAVFEATLAEVAGESPKDLPLRQLATLWVRQADDQPVVETLLEPLRAVMAQPVVNGKTDATFPGNQPVRLIAVKSLSDPPSAPELENPGLTISPGKIISLWRARRLVETHFPSGQEDLGRFAGSFVRANAVPDSGLHRYLARQKNGRRHGQRHL